MPHKAQPTLTRNIVAHDRMTLSDTLILARMSRIVSVGTLHEIRQIWEDDLPARGYNVDYKFPIREGCVHHSPVPAHSNQWLSLPIYGASFREANRDDNGEYNVSVDLNTDSTHRIKLPRTVLGPDGREIMNVADAKNLGLSLVLDKNTFITVTFDPKKGDKGEYLYEVSRPDAWFGFYVPKKGEFYNMVLDDNGMLRDFVKRGGSNGPLLVFERTSHLEPRPKAHPYGNSLGDGETWNGLISLGSFYHFGDLRAHTPPSYHNYVLTESGRSISALGVISQTVDVAQTFRDIIKNGIEKVRARIG